MVTGRSKQQAVAAYIVGVTLTFATQEGIALECPMPPPRSAAQEVLIAKEMFVRSQLLGQWAGHDTAGAAGQARRPRENPNWTIHELRKRFEASQLKNEHVRTLEKSDRLHFVFLHERIRPEVDAIVSASKEALICLTRRGDTVLLSDRFTTHYTTVYHVDRQRGYVYFLDLWPDIVFLRKDLNRAGVAGQLVAPLEVPLSAAGDASQAQAMEVLMALGEKPLVRITLDEYRKVLLGLITSDSPSITDFYYAVSPTSRHDPKVSLAFGLSLLDFGTAFRAGVVKDEARFVEDASKELTRALTLARQHREDNLALRSAQKLSVALLLASYKQVRLGLAAYQNTYKTQLDALMAQEGKDRILKGYSALDFYRLGEAAASLSNMHTAVDMYSRAVAVDPDQPGAYLGRAIAYAHLRDPVNTIGDATEELKRIEARTRVLQQNLRARDDRDAIGIVEDYEGGWLLGANYLLALEIRAGALGKTGRTDEAEADGKEILRKNPKSAKGSAILALCARARGNQEEAVTHLKAAIEKASSPSDLDAYRKLLSEWSR